MENQHFFISYMWESAEKQVKWTPGHGVIKEHPADWLERVCINYPHENYKLISWQRITFVEYEKFNDYM